MMSLLRKTRRSTLKAILVWACLMIPASAFLYSTNGQVRALENEIETTQANVVHEKESLRVLRAEWAYLNNPQRLATASKQYLASSQVVAAVQVVPIERLSTKLAMRDTSSRVADNGSLMIDTSVKAPAILAKPIAFDPSVLATMHRDKKATIAASATWSQKVVSAFSILPALNTKPSAP
jgi:hypothetical protein